MAVALGDGGGGGAELGIPVLAGFVEPVAEGGATAVVAGNAEAEGVAAVARGALSCVPAEGLVGPPQAASESATKTPKGTFQGWDINIAITPHHGAIEFTSCPAAASPNHEPQTPGTFLSTFLGVAADTAPRFG